MFWVRRSPYQDNTHNVWTLMEDWMNKRKEKKILNAFFSKQIEEQSLIKIRQENDNVKKHTYT